MNILIVPDKYKGSLSALQVARCIAKGIQHEIPHSNPYLLPIADGGDGTVDVCAHVLKGSLKTAVVLDAYGLSKEAQYFFQSSAHQSLAIIESAKIVGLAGYAPEALHPNDAHTKGLGMCILHALSQNPALIHESPAMHSKIVVGLGGSATVDGGIGMLESLGYAFEYAYSQYRNPLLNKPISVRLPLSDPLQGDFVVASDVTNPLLGSQGAVYCFGAQKGIAKKNMPQYEEAMSAYAQLLLESGLIKKQNKADSRSAKDRPGAGAAGGLGFALNALLGARIMSGFDILSEYTGLEAKIAEADLVITGEGKLDAQSMHGKVPAGVLSLVKKHKKKLLLIVGRYSQDALTTWKAEERVCGIFASSLVDEPWDVVVANAAPRLQAAARIAIRSVLG